MTSPLQPFSELLLDAVFLVEANGRIVNVNSACRAILGYEPMEMIGRAILEFIHPDDHASTVQEMGHVLSGRPGLGFENRYLRKDGSVAHILWSARWSPEHQLRIGVARDITERKRWEQRQAGMLALATAAHGAKSLLEMLRTFQATLQDLLPLRGMAAVLTPGERLVYAVTGSGLALQAADTVAWQRVPLDVPDMNFGELRLDLDPQRPLSAKDEDLLAFAAGQAAAVLERLALQADLAHAARYDELTGLPNRRLFQDRIQSAIARCRRGQSRGAMLYIDLDDFKQVNDAHGHGIGDQLLQAVALRIAGCVRESDTVARIGGDEFVVLLENVAEEGHAESVAEKIRQAIGASLALPGATLWPSASVGIAHYPAHGDMIDQLMRHADLAMYACKSARRSVKTV